MPRVITARRWRGGRGGRGGGSGGRGGGGGGLGRVVGEAEEREGVEALAAEGALAQRHLQLEGEDEGEGQDGGAPLSPIIDPPPSGDACERPEAVGVAKSGGKGGGGRGAARQQARPRAQVAARQAAPGPAHS